MHVIGLILVLGHSIEKVLNFIKTNNLQGGWEV